MATNTSKHPLEPTNTSVPEHLMYKNRLQTYAQRSAIPLPIYQTVNEGSPHAPRFRATVLIDGATYKSLNTFLHRKAAEQDVAKLALDCISKKLKDGGCPFIHKDTVFCKSILNEFAVKMNLTKPTYTTQQSKGLLPVFVSSLVFDGKTYTGEAGKNKKEAEQLAARTVIQSILGTSGSATLLSEIIKSKSRLYAALYKINDLGLPHGSSSGIYMGIDGVEVMGTNNLQMLGFSEASPEQKHKKPKVEPFVETSTEPVINLTSAVGPYSFGAHSGSSSLPALVVNNSQGTNVDPTCGRKRHSKNKKRAQKKMQGDEHSLHGLRRSGLDVGSKGLSIDFTRRASGDQVQGALGLLGSHPSAASTHLEEVRVGEGVFASMGEGSCRDGGRQLPDDHRGALSPNEVGDDLMKGCIRVGATIAQGVANMNGQAKGSEMEQPSSAAREVSNMVRSVQRDLEVAQERWRGQIEKWVEEVMVNFFQKVSDLRFPSNDIMHLASAPSSPKDSIRGQEGTRNVIVIDEDGKEEETTKVDAHLELGERRPEASEAVTPAFSFQKVYSRRSNMRGKVPDSSSLERISWRKSWAEAEILRGDPQASSSEPPTDLLIPSRLESFTPGDSYNHQEGSKQGYRFQQLAL